MKHKRIIARIIIFLIIFIIIFNMIIEITKRKTSYERLTEFFAQEEDFDVLFFGSSHTIYGVSPLELWNDYGIVSYNLGNYLEQVAFTYYNMRLAIDEKKPKLVVVDAHMIFLNQKIRTDLNGRGLLHNSLDSYPISYLKYEAINDMLDNNASINDFMEYFFPFSMYHSRWNELTKNDFKSGNSGIWKGSKLKVSVAEPRKMSDFSSIKKYSKEETINMIYLRKIIEFCKENDIEILITYIPCPTIDERISESKYVQDICDEYNVNYINFLEMNVVNYDTDCYDENSHLNVSGQRKVTNYLGKYITKNYNIPDQRKNDTYDFWNQDYDKYVDGKISLLNKNTKNLKNYLMLLSNEKDIKYEIVISSKKEITGITEKLLNNLNNNYRIDDEVFKENRDKTIKITTWDNRNGEKISDVWF